MKVKMKMKMKIENGEHFKSNAQNFLYTGQRLGAE
jgi:hypothetical protein